MENPWVWLAPLDGGSEAAPIVPVHIEGLIKIRLASSDKIYVCSILSRFLLDIYSLKLPEKREAETKLNSRDTYVSMFFLLKIRL